MAGPPGPAEGRPEDKLHDPAIQRARVRGHLRIIGSQTLACWMAGSVAGHGERYDSTQRKAALIAVGGEVL
jgi:hypothetical protein